MPTKNANTDPFVARVHAALDKADVTLVYPSLRVVCADSLGSHDAEEEIFTFSNGVHRLYVPAVQFALEAMHNDGEVGADVVSRYATATNDDAEAALRYVDPANTAVSEIDAMRYETSVPGCKEGAKRCPSCHRIDDVTPYQRQTASADEGATTFYHCANKKCPRKGAPFK